MPPGAQVGVQQSQPMQQQPGAAGGRQQRLEPWARGLGTAATAPPAEAGLAPGRQASSPVPWAPRCLAASTHLLQEL